MKNEKKNVKIIRRRKLKNSVKLSTPRLANFPGNSKRKKKK